MATQATLLNDLFTLKNIAKGLYQSCRKERSGIFYLVTPELDHLYDAAGDARIVISRREFRTHQDGNSTVAQLDSLRRRSISDLQELQDLLIIYVRRRSYRMRIDEEDIRRKLRNFKARFQEQYLAFQRICDAANGLENWANLSPSPPTPFQTLSPPVRNDSGPTTHDLNNADPNIAISIPPSPYQPTVEDVEDDPCEESPMVQHHYIRPDEMVPESPKERQNTPPVVLVRAPTDGTEDLDAQNFGSKTPLEQVKANKGKNTDRDEKLEQRKSSQKSSPKSTDLTDNSHGPSRGLTLAEHEHQSTEDIQAEIIRLQAELDGMKLERNVIDPLGQKSSRPRAQHSSIDLGHGDSYSYPQSHGGRHRAFTTPNGERPSQYLSGADATKRVRTPKASPRDPSLDYVEPSTSRKARQSWGQYYLHPSQSPQTPQSAVEFGSSPWLADIYDEGPSPKEKADQYGVHPRLSDTMLPRFRGSDYPPAFDSAGPKRAHRYSYQFRGREEDAEHAGNDWLNTQGGRLGDFDLYGPTPPENEAAAGPSRPSRNSNAQDSHGSRGPETEEARVIERHLPVTLEEIFHGKVKKLKIRRTIVDPITRRSKDEEHMLDVPIYRGLKPGSKIKFSGEGSITSSGVRQDLHFILVEKQHPLFTRRDRDLYCVLEIPLLDSLVGWQRILTSICGKQIKVSHQGPTPSSWQECFAGLGMCSHKNTNERGDLFVGIKIKYPPSLSEKQKRLIRDALH